MPSPTSTVLPLDFSASRSATVQPPAARPAAGRSASGGDPDAFAHTLQHQLDRRPQQHEPASGIAPRTPAPPRAASTGEAAREREAATGPGRERAREAASASRGEGPDRSDAPAQAGADSQAHARAGASDANAGAAAADRSDAERAATLAAAADAADAADAAAADSPHAAALAAVPAAVAAFAQAPAEASARAQDALLDGGARSAPPGSGLPAKTSVSAAAGALAGEADAELADPAPAQARQLLAAAFAERPGGARAGAAGDEGGARSQAATAGGTAQGHGAPPWQALRPLAGSPQAAPRLPVQAAAGARAWAEDVGNQVRWMLGRAESRAELVLTPPSLGRLEVSISLSGDQTTAQFVASSQAARDALEQAMPRLREILQQAGIQLGEASVGTAGDQPAHGEGERRDQRGGGGEQASDAGNEDSPGRWLRQHDGMVDTFA